eukprot:CAMPEP_0181233280 /NCGR_PEP_ID=MMETSP1096-20121128/36243_1 /TAXON_ID=156174 ORGANISM="Chrysochromulina ericina, Strain CCMP281" /NCGR_SAMPLE_ID=MMETSP1096 /ASSEMBLY_ACC=CAM_ASM_000453 /LENGTH=41 /DNA_ID= /DNA_START= /DNA_END= /DNA_ORIENTATION=
MAKKHSSLVRAMLFGEQKGGASRGELLAMPREEPHQLWNVK